MTPELQADLHDAAAADELLVVLDFDGTISAIVPVPSDSRPLPGALDHLDQLGQHAGTEVFLLSGRARQDLAEVSGAGRVAGLIGSHGQESDIEFALSDDEHAALSQLRDDVLAVVTEVAGIRVEDKPGGMAVHVRGVDQAEGERAVQQVRDLAHRTDDVFVLEGKSVIETSVRPLDKGAALSALIEQRPQRRVLFAGDDVTDESAMAVLRDDDLSIRVGDGESRARHRVGGPHEMVEVLGVLARLRAEHARR